MCGAEGALKQSMPDYISRLLREKRLLLLREMLESINYPDKGLVDEIIAGFKLSGWMTRSGVFAAGSKPPSRTIESLLGSATGVNVATLAGVYKEPLKPLHSSAWNETSWSCNMAGCGTSSSRLFVQALRPSTKVKGASYR